MLVLKSKHNLVGFGIFLVSISAAVIGVTIAAFPILIPSLISEIPSQLDPLEPSNKAAGIIISNVIVFGLLGLYYKKRLPHVIHRSFGFLLDFEVPKNIAFLAMTVFLGFYILFNVAEVLEPEPWDDFNRIVRENLEEYTGEGFFTNPVTNHIPNFLGNLSMDLFGTYRVIPFLGSITLVVFTYLLTLEITQKRFAGLVSSVLLLSSGVFRIYDTTITYTIFWVLFYVVSLYCVFKFWPASPISYLLTIPSKAISVLFLPMSLFFIWRVDIAKKRKLILLAVFGGLIVFGLVYVALESPRQFQTEEFSSDEFWAGYAALSLQLRNDPLILMFLVPLVAGLYIVSRRGVRNAEALMGMIFGLVFLAPLLPSITDYTNNPYRFIPLSTFFAVGVATLLTKIRQH